MWGSIYQFNADTGKFNPGFRKTDKVRFCEGLRDQTRLQSEASEEWNEC